MKSNDMTILVLSCDKYADLWKPFFMLFRKYWPNCPYPVVLGSNTVRYKPVETILSGADVDWSTSLRALLKKISTPYVFIWLDDIFAIGKVHPADFAAALDYVKTHDGKHMHMLPSPKPERRTSDGRYGIYEKGIPYRSTALGFWNVAYLKNLLLPGETAWNFEVMGSYRSLYDEGFYCTLKPLFPSLHVIEKGKIFRAAYEYCQTYSIPLSIDHRNVLANEFQLKSEIQKVYFNSVKRIPWKIRVSMMNVLRKLFISY